MRRAHRSAFSILYLHQVISGRFLCLHQLLCIRIGSLWLVSAQHANLLGSGQGAADREFESFLVLIRIPLLRRKDVVGILRGWLIALDSLVLL